MNKEYKTEIKYRIVLDQLNLYQVEYAYTKHPMDSSELYWRPWGSPTNTFEEAKSHIESWKQKQASLEKKVVWSE